MIRIVNTNREIPIVNSYNEPFRLGQVRRFWIFKKKRIENFENFELPNFIKNISLNFWIFETFRFWEKVLELIH